MSTVTRLDRARGLLLGLALGDALGAPFEGHPDVTEADILALERGAGQLTYTDDTALALVLAGHLARRLGTDAALDPDTLAPEFAEAWRHEPDRGYGGTVREVFRLIDTGVPWREAGATFGGEGSLGNGGAMRVAPVALVAPDAAGAADLARRSAEVTHAHEQGVGGAVCQAVAAYLALAGEPAEATGAARFVEDLMTVPGLDTEPWPEKLGLVAALAVRDVSPAGAAEQLGNDVTAAGSVPLALLSFLRHPDRPGDAIRWAIRAGGDTDTIAAMAGALGGARCGAEALPRDPVPRLEAVDTLYAVAAALAGPPA